MDQVRGSQVDARILSFIVHYGDPECTYGPVSTEKRWKEASSLSKMSRDVYRELRGCNTAMNLTLLLRRRTPISTFHIPTTGFQPDSGPPYSDLSHLFVFLFFCFVFFHRFGTSVLRRRRPTLLLHHRWISRHPERIRLMFIPLSTQ